MKLVHERQVSASECVFVCVIYRLVRVHVVELEPRYRKLRFDERGQATGYCSKPSERYDTRTLQQSNYIFTNINLNIFQEFAMIFDSYHAKKQDEPVERINQDSDDISTRTRR